MLALTLSLSTQIKGKEDAKDVKKESVKPNPKCKAGYGLTQQGNQVNEINFCTEHAGRTCCNQDDVNKVKAKIGMAKIKCDVSDQCFSMTTRALCSYCDGDIVSFKKIFDDFTEFREN